MRVCAVVPDLLFGSKVKAMLEEAGHDVALASTPADDADALVVDLTAMAPEDVALGTVPALGVYAHVEPEVRARALAHGFAVVVPRSRFMREGADLVGALAPGS